MLNNFLLFLYATFPPHIVKIILCLCEFVFLMPCLSIHFCFDTISLFLNYSCVWLQNFKKALHIYLYTILCSTLLSHFWNHIWIQITVVCL